MPAGIQPDREVCYAVCGGPIGLSITAFGNRDPRAVPPMAIAFR